MSKGKKPKKPISKKVSLLLEQLARRRGVRELEKRFLIVCEDGMSAPNYFEALKKHFQLSAASIRVVGSEGRTQPVQVVERAIEMRSNAARADSGTVPFGQTWCVIDGDYGNKITNARKKAKANDIHLAISTMCFEYWVLLHFVESDTATADCDGVIDLLKHPHIPGYEKGTYDFYEMVKNVHDACARAEKLRKPGLARGDLPENQNPCSEVYKLINEIIASPSTG